MILGEPKEIPPKTTDFEPDVIDIRLKKTIATSTQFCVWQKLQNDQFELPAAGHSQLVVLRWLTLQIHNELSIPHNKKVYHAGLDKCNTTC